MKNVSANDFYSIVKVGNFSFAEPSTLFSLYSPIVGGRAISTYQALLFEDNGTNLRIHRSLFLKLQSNPGEFFQDIESLESVGLVKTFLKEDSGIKYFQYRLFPCLNAISFFDDLLLSTCLKRYVGEEVFSSIKKSYLQQRIEPSYQNITSNFEEIHSNEKNVALIKTNFDNGAFFSSLLPYQLNESSFSRQEIVNIIKISALYPVDESSLAQIVAKYYQSNLLKGKRLNLEAIKDEAKAASNFHFISKKSINKPSSTSGESEMSELIRLMDSMSPIEYLSMLQNGGKPVDSELKLVESLSIDLGLSEGVVNAIISYALQKNNNVLTKAYCEKLGASLAREGVNNARDAMDCLNRYSASGKAKRYKNSQTPHYVPKAKAKASEEREEKEEEVSIEEALKALSSLKEKQ